MTDRGRTAGRAGRARRLSVGLVAAGILVLSGCAGEPEQPVRLFEEGSVDRFELGGQTLDPTDHMVLCLWVSSVSGGLTILPADEYDPDAFEAQIGFDRSTGELDELVIRANDGQSTWTRAESGSLTLEGSRFVAEGVYTVDGAARSLAIEGTCETDFDTVVG